MVKKMSNKFGMTHAEIAEILGITRSVVCKIEKQAIDKLRRSGKVKMLKYFLYENY